MNVNNIQGALRKETFSTNVQGFLSYHISFIFQTTNLKNKPLAPKRKWETLGICCVD